MATLFIGACALACPVGMLGMIWFMRSGHKNKNPDDE